MKIAYTSDLHIDFYLRDAQVSKLTLDKFFGHYFRDAESKYLIIAGDIGHYPEQSMIFMDYLRELYGFEEILVVMGNHECVARGTEVLTTDGWILAALVTQEHRVAQYSMGTRGLTYDHPLAIAQTFKKRARVIETSLSKQIVSLGHNVVTVDGKVLASEVTDVSDKDIPVYGMYSNPLKVTLTDDELRLLTWVIIDGTIRGDEGIKCRTQFKLSKPRKIEELLTLLTRLCLSHTIKPATLCDSNKLQPYTIRMYGDTARDIWDMLSGIKLFPKSWVNLSKQQLHVVLETIVIIDGRRQVNDIEWTTIETQNRDVIQTACIHNQVQFRYRAASGYTKDTSKIPYHCTIFTEEKQTNYKYTARTIAYNGYMTAIQMPLGTLVTRIDGKPAITGNCYLVNDKQRKMFPSGLHKSTYQQDLFAQNGIKVLDGTSYVVNGITIGGASSFYDGTVYFRMSSGYYKSDGGLNALWKRTMNDSKMMRLDDFGQYAKDEKEKLRGLLGSVDLMVSHVKPVVSNKYFSPEFQGDITNAFYSFDFEEEIANSNISTWIYGHTHTVETFDFLGTQLLANPVGYPKEARGKFLKYVEIK